MRKTECHPTYAVEDLDFANLPISGDTLVFGHEIMLADNFDAPLDESDVSRFMLSPYPFKLNFAVAMLCTRGAIRVRLNLIEYELQKDDVLVVLPGSIGECLSFSEDYRTAIMIYPQGHVFEGFDTALSIAFRNFINRHPLIHLTPEEMEEALTLYRLMRNKMRQPATPLTREALECCLKLLCLNGYQWYAAHSKETEGKERTDRKHFIFNRFITLVRQHYTTERKISFYADKMCLTPKYLSIAIHEASGRYAGEWIKDYVILEAKALLRSRKYTAQQVGDLLNFPNASFFGKYFKAATGCTPKAYMRE